LAIDKRALTVNFQRSVTGDGPPTVMEVAVNPLATPDSPNLDATLVGRETQDVILGDGVTSVVFMLVPTDHPDLSVRVPYRIAWREKYMGRMYTSDFVMPDFDTDFDDLHSAGNIIGGETYVQWSDRSRPGGVAGLDTTGRVIDAQGNVVGGAEDAAVVQGHLDSEVVARQQGDNNVRSFLTQQLTDQINQTYVTSAANLSAAVSQLQNADTTERAQRQTGDGTLNARINVLSDSTTQITGEITSTLNATRDQLATKADLVNGVIPSSQLPAIALGHAVAVSNQTEMLALTSSQIQPGDFAIRPDGIFFLNAAPASSLGNWVQFQINASVFSVNGQGGAVVLGAGDVGARSSSTPVPLADVAGLASALSGKTDISTTTAINNRLTTVENDSTIVHSSAGLIARSLMPIDAAFINNSNLVTKKDGTVLNLGSGGTLQISDVTGLQTALDAKVLSTDARLTNARVPTLHAASHGSGGTDPVTPASIGARATGVDISPSEITGLAVIISNNGLTSTSNLDGHISSLEGRVEDLELGGGGGGGGSGASGKTVWFSSTGLISPLDTSSDDIEIRSPFGFDGTSYSYDPAGVDPSVAVWPYLTPNGHLKFIARDETAPADAVLATQDNLNTLTTLVGTKATSADLATTNAAVATKADQTVVDSLQTDVNTRATTTALNSTNTAVALKASQSALDALATTVGGKAAQTTVDALTATVGTKAATSVTDGLNTRLSTVETGKADLVTGTVPLSQLPSFPTSKVTGLDTSLTAKADLVTGKVPVGQLPDLGIVKVTGLQSTLDAKADLVGGVVPTNQLPSLSFVTAIPVASRSAMLGLNTTQVQPGDVAVITATVDKGSYILNATDPSVFTNWVKLVAPDDAVSSVNGQIGPVVLGPSDVGARSSSLPIAMSEITNLPSSLAAKADAATTTTALAGKTSPTDVQALMSASTANKQRADYVATSAVASPAGQQSVDGTLVPLGAIVLLTAQGSSVVNGLWVVNSGAWTRVSDMNTGDFFLRGTQVVVASGTANANTIWQQTNTSGVVGTNANNWTRILVAGAPPTYTATLGVQKIGNDFRAAVVSGGGIIAVAGGLQRDPLVLPGKYSIDVPSGSTVVTITHNLNTTDVQVQVRDKSASSFGDYVEIGWKPTGLNTISMEFGLAPTSGQYRVTVMG
jgi:hypothetical protein